MTAPKLLDFGSGYKPEPGFMTCDIGGSSALDYYFKDNKITCNKETFDVIRCRNVLHHVEDLNRLFKEFWRALKPGGGIIIVEPRQEIFQENVALDHLWYRLVMPRYEVWYAKEYREYVKEARKVGFTSLMKMPLCRELEIAVLSKKGNENGKAND